VAGSRAGGGALRPLRVGVLLHERMVDENPGIQSTLAKLQHEIEQAGHVCFLSKPCQASLRTLDLDGWREMPGKRADGLIVRAGGQWRGAA
jgi:hypothetical protein